MSTDSQEAGLYTAYAALMTMAVIPIYSGSIISLAGMKRPANAPKRKKTDSPLEDSDDEDEAASESLSASDAWMFPVMGSAVLFSLYLVFRFLDKKYIDYLITTYFSFMGCFAVASTGLIIAKKTIPLSLLKHVNKYRLTLSKNKKSISHISFTVVHFILLFLSVILTVYYGITKNWVASNVFGLSFSVNAVKLLSLDSFKTGMILLSGLFFYDIFWVFGTEVMVSVAKNFDAPIKVIWPRDIFQYLFQREAEHQFTMLGLGDIVIPGIFVALCLRFDRHMSWKRNPTGEFRSTAFAKPYFTACLIAYVAGLATTMAVMHIFHAAQPALLYLSPACILSTLITASFRGELKELFEYTTEEDAEKDKDKGKEKTEKETTAQQEPASPAVEEIAEEDNADEEEEEVEDYVAVVETTRKRKPGKGGRKRK